MTIQAEHSIVINRSIEEVFAYCTDEKAAAEWQGGVSESYADGPPGVGVIVTEVRHVMGQRMESQVQTTEYDPPYRVAFKVLKGPVAFEGVQTFEEVPEGTRVSISLVGEPGGFFKVAAGMLEKQVKKDFERDFVTLKQILEG